MMFSVSRYKPILAWRPCLSGIKTVQYILLHVTEKTEKPLDKSGVNPYDERIFFHADER